MSFSRYRFSSLEQDEITFDTFQHFLNSVDTFTTFCEHSVFKVYSRPLSTLSYSRVERHLENALKRIPALKMIRPLKTLCIRLLEANQGLSILHLQLLQLCHRSYLPKEAMQVMTRKALPKKMTRSEYSKYCRYCGLLYLNLDNLPMAYKKLKEAASQESEDVLEHIDNIKKIILLSLALGNKQTPQTVKETYQKVKTMPMSVRQERYLQSISEQEVRAYIDILEGKPLTDEHIRILQKDGHIDLCRRIPDPKLVGLKTYVLEELAPSYSLMEVQEAKEISLSDFANIQEMNYLKAIYKYDSQKRTVNFVHDNHRITDQKVSEDVSDCMDSYQEVAKNRVEKSQRMGGDMGGFGGFGGRGGFMSRF